MAIRSVWFSVISDVDMTTVMGPVVSVAAAQKIQKQIDEAVEMGATLEIPPGTYSTENLPQTFLTPQILTNVTHEMSTPQDYQD